jgi:putative restriction endonuclease
VSRPFRDRAFRANIRRAYAGVCAVSGLVLTDHKGRFEAHAAHIRAVEAGGTDSVRNGLSLCGTVHWLFDRGLISVTDEFDILLSSSLPNEALKLVRSERKIILPTREDSQPHRMHLAYHRREVFRP